MQIDTFIGRPGDTGARGDPASPANGEYEGKGVSEGVTVRAVQFLEE